jgi:hypothetical protein
MDQLPSGNKLISGILEIQKWEKRCIESLFCKCTKKEGIFKLLSQKRQKEAMY